MLTLLLSVVSFVLTVTCSSADPIPIDRPLIAYWDFNENAGIACHDISGNGHCAVVKSKDGIVRRHGVYSGGLDLHGENAIDVNRFGHTELDAISFSAWARPTELSGYRELFRQECDNRLLFSFQVDGAFLSLGLNINGYIECRAPIDSKRVMDGLWHHCAATFDGKDMRVFLDGKQIGTLERPGKIACDPDVHCFIGSSGGNNEFFQGGLDELRIYSEALTPDDIANLYTKGIDSLAELDKKMDSAVGDLYAPTATFAGTLAATREKTVKASNDLDTDVAEAIVVRLKKAFPSECDSLQEWAGASCLDFLKAKDEAFIQEKAERLIDLLLEYKPLTEHQWKNQTADDLRKWDEADRIKKQFDDLKARGESAVSSPDWIDLILEAGGKIQFRPHVNEPVAPYVKPETPATRDLTAEEARDALERDWLFQADGNPTPDRIESEIKWTRELAARIDKGLQPLVSISGKIDFARQLDALDALEREEPSRDLYFKVRAIKRNIMFRNPVIDFSKLLLVDMPFPQGSEWPHETRHRLGYMAVPGGRLLILDGLHPDGKLTQLMPQPIVAQASCLHNESRQDACAAMHGSFWRPDVSYDGQKVLFCFKPHNEKSFHLYEINVNGTGLVQLTDGIYDDLDPIYLPDGHILFSSSRGHTYVRCMPPTNAYSLTRCDADGSNIYLVSYNNEPDYLPSVLNDGRVGYTRWEYTDKPLWRAEKLWTVNPDGSQESTLWGNQSVWPDLTKDVRSIPGSRRMMFTGSAHHNWFSGSVGIIDPEKGLNFPNGLTKITADVEWPECGNGPVDPIESPNYHASGKYTAYYSPYPLSEQDFLVSANREGKFRLYLMDVEGNRELIYEDVNNIFDAMPLKPRVKPPVIADRVAWPSKDERTSPKDGVIFSSNVYQGAPDELRGKAKYLRIMHIDPKTYTYWYKRPYISTGPVVSAVQSEGVKRIIGIVPIEEDGSVAFTAPASKSLHFQLLDENHRALQTMRSFVGVMPGERRGCLGCHESHSRTPVLSSKSIALNKEPRAITPPPWDDTTVSWARYVRPVLDKYCAECHEGAGKARETFDMTERPSAPIFTEPYLTMIGRPTWGAPYQKPDKPVPGFGIANMIMVEAYGTVDPCAYKTPKPMTCLSYNSRLIDIASSGKHHEVKVDPVSLERLIVWIDAMCPYCGDDEIRAMPDPEFQGVDWLAIRPVIKSAPVITRPGPVE